MTKYLILAALLVVGVLAYVVYPRSSGPATAVPSVRPEPVRIASPVTPTGGVAPAPSTTVVSLSGRVEKRAGAHWIELSVGDRLTAQDAIRTGEDSRATLDIGGLIEVDSRTELTVGEISSSIAQLALTEGRVTANAGGAGGTRIRISTRDTDAVAETDHGRFDVLSSGRGQVTVAVAEGDVTLTARNQAIVIPAGKLSTVQSGAVPSTPRDIPPSLFLKVSAAAHARDRAALRGETTPGAVVSINGVRTAADDRGAFTGEVPLVKGANTIIVSVEDATGRRERRVIQRTIETGAPPRLKTQVEWK